jgi:hypothetical protein
MAISFDRLHLVEPSPEARRLLWHVLSVGVVSRDEPERHEAHDKPGAFLFWMVSGQGTLKFKNGSFPLRTGPRCWLLDLRHPRVYVPAPGRKLVTNGLRYAYDFMGPDRLLFASDRPWVNSKEILDGLRSLGLPAADETKILGANARSLFRL